MARQAAQYKSATFVVIRVREPASASLLDGNVVAAVSQLKAQPGGEIQVHGSGNLLQTLLKHDLVDTLRIWVFPLVLGTGKRLFVEGPNPGGFRLVDSQVNTKGAVLHVYERAGGELQYGLFEAGSEPVVLESRAE